MCLSLLITVKCNRLHMPQSLCQSHLQYHIIIILMNTGMITCMPFGWLFHRILLVMGQAQLSCKRELIYWKIKVRNTCYFLCIWW
ncbi:hypothetical protein [Sulfolobus spindle-shaped virus]|nr:hypothetical protein [Sulfolobus spindle-shaped virus]AZG03512.1 hypothetical protein [Sulfolobus spindle-shaped virus]